VASVIIIEDDIRIRQTLTALLAERGHDVEAAGTGLAGLESALSHAPDVIVLDLGLPDIDGGELLKMIRAVTSVPVIVATARDDEQEIVRLLDAGADDYVVKPFSARHLDARIRAVLRRTGGGEDDKTIQVGDLVIDVTSREASIDGRALSLTRKEFDLLAYLAQRPGIVVGKRELLAEVWRQPYGGADKTVDVHLSWLRKKLGESAAEPKYLHTVRGVGVKLVAP
jgi:two-component system, OmpR family, KDP operon response regulator KdpE